MAAQNLAGVKAALLLGLDRPDPVLGSDSSDFRVTINQSRPNTNEQNRELHWIAEPEHFVILQNTELITYTNICDSRDSSAIQKVSDPEAADKKTNTFS